MRWTATKRSSAIKSVGRSTPGASSRWAPRMASRRSIWLPLARPALELVAPHLRPRAVVVCDNTEIDRRGYSDYFAFINDPAQHFLTMTLPFSGGLEMSVRLI